MTNPTGHVRDREHRSPESMSAERASRVVDARTGVASWWPLEARDVHETIRDEGAGSLRVRTWSSLSRCGFVIGYAGIMLTPILLCDLAFGAPLRA